MPSEAKFLGSWSQPCFLSSLPSGSYCYLQGFEKPHLKLCPSVGMSLYSQGLAPALPISGQLPDSQAHPTLLVGGIEPSMLE